MPSGSPGMTATTGSPGMTAMTSSPASLRPAPLEPQDHTETTVRIGMSDVDAYGFLYYATYIKYNERMANLISPAHALAVCGVQMMKFVRSVTWGSEITIATFLCPPAHGSSGGLHAEAAGEEHLRLIHAWYCTDDVDAADADGAASPRATGHSPKPTPLTAHNISICSYKMPPSAAAREAAVRGFIAPPKSHPLFRQLLVCVREALTPVPPLPPVCAPLAPSRQRELCITILPDAIGYGGRLAPSVALDLFERARTAIIGGQPNLAWLKEEGVAVVVYRLREMLLPATPVPLGGRVTSVSSEASANDGLFFDVRQQIELEGGEVLASCYVRMVFLRNGVLTKPPPRIVAAIEARREDAPKLGEEMAAVKLQEQPRGVAY